MLDRRKIRDHRGDHPWRLIGFFPDWNVEITRGLSEDHLGLTLHDERRIPIEDGLDIAARRKTLCHESGHVLRGPASACHALYKEPLVERQAARLSVPSVQRIGHALAWHRARYDHTARDLWVDEKQLNARLPTLAPAERGWLHEQLATILVWVAAT